MGFNCSKRHLAAFALAGLLTNSVYSAPYEIIDLGNFGGFKSVAFALNEINEVVGNADGAEIPQDQVDQDNLPPVCSNGVGLNFQEFCDHAFYYSNGVITDLGVLNNDGSFAISINNSSNIVGFALETIDDGDPDTFDQVLERAFISIAGGPIEALPFPDETAFLPAGINPVMRAQHISDANVVTGFAFIGVLVPDTEDTFIPTRVPYLYDYDAGTFQFIPAFEEDDLDFTGTGRSINSSGQVVGWGSISLESFHCFHKHFGIRQPKGG